MVDPVSASWDRITAWLRTIVPDEAARFQPPVPADELDAAASALGVTFPDDFAELYRLNNGTDPEGESVGVFPSADDGDDMAFGPMALDQIVQECGMLKELLEMGQFADCEPDSAGGVAADWWNVGWIPFADNGGGDYYCIDLAPAAGGTAGQVITHSHETGAHRILAKSLAEYLAGLADSLESGRFEYDEDYGVRQRDDDEGDPE